MDVTQSDSKSRHSSAGNRRASFAYAYVDRKLPVLFKRDVIVLTPKHVPELNELITQESTQVFGTVDVYEILWVDPFGVQSILSNIHFNFSVWNL